jgi:hypothetical protein
MFSRLTVQNPRFHITVSVDWETGKPDNEHTHTHTYYDSEILFTDFVVDYTVKIK